MPVAPKLLKFTTTSPVIASFNFNDVITGAGYVEFFGIIGPGPNDFNMINFLDDGTTSVIASDSTFPDGTTTMADFPVFNNPRVLNGTAYYTGKASWSQASGGSTILKIYHVNGNDSTETLIGTYDIMSHNVSGQVNRFTSGVITETYFAIGDFIRLKCTVSILANGWVPTASTTDPFKIAIPFKVDL